MTRDTIAFRSRGLWLPGVRVEIQDVKKAHRKECYICARVPKVRRLSIRQGSGRSALSQILCASCGVHWTKMILREGARVVGVLDGTITDGRPVRLGWSVAHRASIRIKHAMRPKTKEPKS